MRSKHVGFGILAVLAVLILASSDKDNRGSNLPQDASDGTGTTTVSSSAEPKNRGGRILGIDVTMPADKDYGKAFATARQAGAQNVSLALNWDQVETAPGAYDDTFPAIADAFYPPQGARVSLLVRPVDTNGAHLPEDLKGRRLDDPEVIRRFNALMDHLFATMPNVELSIIGVGNEIDLPYGADKDKWDEFRNFFVAVKQHIKSVKSSVPVGTTVTFDGLVGKSSPLAAELNSESDAIIVTYYPLKGDLTVKEPSVVFGDFERMASLPDRKPIYVMEAGYPSSTANKSSEALQAQFVRNVFSAWDSHAERIRLVQFSWMHDLSDAEAAGFKSYYGIGDKKFLEYLRTLGLRTNGGSGSDKLAWAALVEEAGKRGW